MIRRSHVAGYSYTLTSLLDEHELYLVCHYLRLLFSGMEPCVPVSGVDVIFDDGGVEADSDEPRVITWLHSGHFKIRIL